MGQAELIIIGFTVFGGYGTAYFFKNMARLWQRWGALTYFLFPAMFMAILYSGAIVAAYQNVWVSSLYALIFVMRFIKADD